MDKPYMMLHTDGNFIKNERGELVRLLGLNRAGLEWNSEDKEILDSIRAACDDWKANMIRLPVSQDRWFGYAPEQQGKDPDGEKYRELIDEILEEVYTRGKYLILDLHWSNCGEWGKYIGQHYMPDMYSVDFWVDAAKRYKNHPAMLFGIYNEPHDVDWSTWLEGGMVTETNTVNERKQKITYETPGIQHLANIIRGQEAKNLLVIAGLDWGFTLDGIAKGYQIDDKNGNGILYDSHVYPWKTVDWDTVVTLIADQYPILIGECGHYGDEAKPKEGAQRESCTVWAPKLLNWIDKHNYHLAAWCFHPQAGPCLIKGFDNEPTPFWGMYIKEYLQKKDSR